MMMMIHLIRDPALVLMVPELKEIQVGLYLVIIMIMIMIMIIIIIIIKAAFIMCTFPSSAYVQGATYYYYLGRWIQFQDRTYSAQFPLPREHSLPICLLVLWHYRQIHTQHIFFCILPGPHFIHLGGEQQCAWIKCLAEGQKCQALRESNLQPFDPESRVQSNIPRHEEQLSTCPFV